MTILLVRHARAGRRDRWKGEDRLRPLSKKGRLQAEGLSDVLAPWIGNVEPLLISSPWVRCTETLAPFATSLGLVVAVDETLGEGMSTKALDALGGWLGRRPVILCTHGDVIEAILLQLSDEGVDLGAKLGAAKGSVWVLDGSRRTVLTARYLPPPC